jgi:hypothetical protein
MVFMQSILHSLFNGRIIPWERREPRSKERLEVIRKIECEERYFIEKMSSDDCHRFQALSNLYSEIVSTEEENIFSYGFTLGLLLMLDVMNQSESL